MKTTVVFYNASPLDEAFYPEQLKAAFDVTFVAEELSAATATQAAAAQVISVRNSSPVPAQIMELLPKLRHVACRTTGFDNVDFEYAKAHSITISVVPAYGESTVAEYTFLLLMAVCRRLMLTAHATRFGAVVAEKLTGHDLYSKTLGVIGTGRIGRHTAQIARGFGMKVVAYDLYPDATAAERIGYDYLPLDDVLAQADYLALHAPATAETHHLLNAKTLAQTKPGVFIINTARGTLIDTAALIDALESGHVAGAGLDVIDGEGYLWAKPTGEPTPQQAKEHAKYSRHMDILTKMPNVLITAHNAYNTAEALGRIRDTTAANLLAWQTGQPQNLVA